MATPELTVVIVSRASRAELAHLLPDLQRARAVVPLEVRVVDNASPDGSAGLVRSGFPWVTLEALADNVGFGTACNRGLAHVDTPLTLLLNPDCRIHADDIAAMCAAITAMPDVGILSPRVLRDDGRPDPNAHRGFPTLWGVLCHVTGLDRRLPGTRSRRYTLGLDGAETADVEAVSGAVMLCRTRALREVGGFDERFFLYGEDIDLCLRVRAAGWRVRYWPQAIVRHHGGRSGATTRSRHAWARSIGELHRLHRPGTAGLISGAVADAAGRALARLPRAGDPA